MEGRTKATYFGNNKSNVIYNKATITTTAIAGVIFQANVKCQARAECFALSSLQFPQPYK